MSPIVSLSDVGYRQFGPLPSGGGGLNPRQLAWIASQCSDYEAEGAWVRRRGRRKVGRFIDGFQILDVIDGNTAPTDDRLGFVDDYFSRSEFAGADVPRLTTSNDDLRRLVESAESEGSRWRGMHFLYWALALAGPQRLKPLLRDYALPCFFRLYPEGRVAVIRYNSGNDDAAALLRVFYAAAHTPLPELRKIAFGGIRTLQEWHLNSLAQLGPLVLDLFLFLFYPFVGGYRGGPPGLDFLFLFEPAEAYMPEPHPRNWLSVASAVAGFGRERVPIYETLRDFQGPAWQHAAHQRFRHGRGYTVVERLDLLKWYVGKVNRLFYELTDLANFTAGRTPEAVIDPVFAFEHHLSVDRLLRKTLLSMSLEEVGTAKHLVFEVAELYDGMSMLFGNNTGAGSFFKRLFDTQQGPDLLRDRLGQLPGLFGVELPTLADQLYRRIESIVIDSVWLKAKVTQQGILVRKKEDLTQEELVPRPRFVAELMRAYRNAHHGYFTDADGAHKRPSRYLFLVDGDLPAELTALPALWWLAYLADPGMIGWEHLPIHSFD
jgi:hypothetical protein